METSRWWFWPNFMDFHICKTIGGPVRLLWGRSPQNPKRYSCSPYSWYMFNNKSLGIPQFAMADLRYQKINRSLRNTLVRHSLKPLSEIHLEGTLCNHYSEIVLENTCLRESSWTLVWDTLVRHFSKTPSGNPFRRHSCRQPFWNILVEALFRATHETLFWQHC